MCGIAGFWQQGGAAVPLEETVRRMTDAIAHRGPDADGHWVDRDVGVALGHRRLSILDLSAAGAQPMVSAAGRYVVSFNGEVYNWRELRSEEERHGAQWRGHSDTEVILALADRLGAEEMLKRAEGMFAFALWDRAERRLMLARDRFGEKPLYWGWVGGMLVFGSELRALRTVPGWQGGVDRDALALLMRHNYIPEPYSIHTGVQKLPPASYAWFPAGAPGRAPAIATYWSLAEVARRGVADPIGGSEAEILDRLDAALREAVGQEMVADVPLGAFLSGGIDSSLIVAQMQRQSSRPVRTFTIGFEDPSYDESGYARAVAAHLGTDHTELTVSAADALAVVPELARIYDEPFADSSQVPTFLVSKLARQHVTVSLSGDGADELFSGYSRYGFGLKVEGRMSQIPRVVGAGAAAAINLVPRPVWDIVGAGIPMPEGFRGRVTGNRMRVLAGILGAPTRIERYRTQMSLTTAPEALVLDAHEPRTAFDGAPLFGDPVDEMSYLDGVAYLPGDILVKVDRAAMAVSLESRAPYLHPRVAEVAWGLPRGMKWRGGHGKWALRALLERYVPRTLTERPKMGFGVPLGSWLRNDLREWAEGLLSVTALERDGIIAVTEVRARWQEHLREKRDWGSLLWCVLMFQEWRASEGVQR